MADFGEIMDTDVAMDFARKQVEGAEKWWLLSMRYYAMSVDACSDCDLCDLSAAHEWKIKMGCVAFDIAQFFVRMTDEYDKANAAFDEDAFAIARIHCETVQTIYKSCMPCVDAMSDFDGWYKGVKNA